MLKDYNIILPQRDYTAEILIMYNTRENHIIDMLRKLKEHLSTLLEFEDLSKEEKLPMIRK